MPTSAGSLGLHDPSVNGVRLSRMDRDTIHVPLSLSPSGDLSQVGPPLSVLRSPHCPRP